MFIVFAVLDLIIIFAIAVIGIFLEREIDMLWEELAWFEDDIREKVKNKK